MVGIERDEERTRIFAGTLKDVAAVSGAKIEVYPAGATRMSLDQVFVEPLKRAAIHEIHAKTLLYRSMKSIRQGGGVSPQRNRGTNEFGGVERACRRSRQSIRVNRSLCSVRSCGQIVLALKFNAPERRGTRVLRGLPRDRGRAARRHRPGARWPA